MGAKGAVEVLFRGQRWAHTHILPICRQLDCMLQSRNAKWHTLNNVGMALRVCLCIWIYGALSPGGIIYQTTHCWERLIACGNDTRSLPEYYVARCQRHACSPETIAREVASYEEKFYSPLGAARRGFLDDIIVPSETRRRLISELRLLRDKHVDRPWRKHGNLPL